MRRTPVICLLVLLSLLYASTAAAIGLRWIGDRYPSPFDRSIDIEKNGNYSGYQDYGYDGDRYQFIIDAGGATTDTVWVYFDIQTRIDARVWAWSDDSNYAMAFLSDNWSWTVFNPQSVATVNLSREQFSLEVNTTAGFESDSIQRNEINRYGIRLNVGEVYELISTHGAPITAAGSYEIGASAGGGVSYSMRDAISGVFLHVPEPATAACLLVVLPLIAAHRRSRDH